MNVDAFSKHDDGPNVDRLLPFPVALGVVLVMWLIYSGLTWQPPPEPWYTILSLIPGSVSIAVLYASGLSKEWRFIRISRLSRPGFLAIVLVTFALAPILLSGTWSGWNGLDALVYGPVSAVAQELFFRAALLAGLLQVQPQRPRLAIMAHALLFVLWHANTFREAGNVGISLAIGLVLFAVGLGWGWAAKRDRTIVWTTIHHALFLFLMSMFSWG